MFFVLFYIGSYVLSCAQKRPFSSRAIPQYNLSCSNSILRSIGFVLLYPRCFFCAFLCVLSPCPEIQYHLSISMNNQMVFTFPDMVVQYIYQQSISQAFFFVFVVAALLAFLGSIRQAEKGMLDGQICLLTHLWVEKEKQTRNWLLLSCTCGNQINLCARARVVGAWGSFRGCCTVQFFFLVSCDGLEVLWANDVGSVGMLETCPT